MSETLDPYHKWLGIPPDEQPPHLYRLLGIAPFESDADVIANAADQRITHVRTFQLGPHSKTSQRLLNEIAAARVCLLTPEKKAAYDANLQSQLEASSKPADPPAAASAPTVPLSAPAPRKPPPRRSSQPVAAAGAVLPSPADSPAPTDSAGTVDIGPDTFEFDLPSHSRSPGRKQGGFPIASAIIAGGVVVALGLGAGVLWWAARSGGAAGAKGGAQVAVKPSGGAPSVIEVPRRPDSAPKAKVRPPRKTAGTPTDERPPSQPPADDPPPKIISEPPPTTTPGTGEKGPEVVVEPPPAPVPSEPRESPPTPGIPPPAAREDLEQAEQRLKAAVDAAAKPEDFVAATESGLALVERAAADGKPELAKRVAGLTLAASRKTGDRQLEKTATRALLTAGQPRNAAKTGPEGIAGLNPSPARPPSAPRKPGQPAPATVPFDEAQAKRHQQAWATFARAPVVLTNSIGMKLALVPAGEFWMGSPATDDKRGSDETIHWVQIGKPYYLGVCEVTHGEYLRVMGRSPISYSFSSSTEHADPRQFPASFMTWDDAGEFCRRLSAVPDEQAAGRAYRLPTEAEWEFACRAGTTTRFSFGDDEAQLPEFAAHRGTTSRSRYRPVGQKRPNAWGLHDLHGGQSEWCQDWYEMAYYEQFARQPAVDPLGPVTGSERVLRGGSWSAEPRLLRSASRGRSFPQARNQDFGFRVVCAVGF